MGRQETDSRLRRARPGWFAAIAAAQTIAVACAVAAQDSAGISVQVQANSGNRVGSASVPTLNPSPTLSTSPQTAQPTQDPGPVRLGRGINLANALEAPNEGDWGVTIEPGYFGTIRAAGFDHVRLPIRWSAHAANAPPYIVYPDFFTRIDTVVDQALTAGLKVVVDMHHYEDLVAAPDGNQARFLAIWAQIATRYRTKPSSALIYEPLNEPHGALDGARWNVLLADVVREIRVVDGAKTIVADCGKWGGIGGLTALELPDDPRIVGSFHFYEPFLFTHQGAEWVGPEHHTVGLTWPGPPAVAVSPNAEAAKTAWTSAWFQDYNTLPAVLNPAGPATVADQLDRAVHWRERTGKPVYLGEFGAYGKGDYASRVRWTAAVRQEAERRGMDWAYWEFGAGFGAYDRAARTWHPELLGALIPSPGATLPPPPIQPATTTALDAVVYDDRLRAGWQNWSWDGDVTLSDTSRLEAGLAALAWKPRKAWAGLFLHLDGALDLTGFAALSLRLQASGAGQSFSLYLRDRSDKQNGKTVDLAAFGGAPAIGRWTRYVVPLEALGLTSRVVTGIILQDKTGEVQPWVYVDEIGFTKGLD